MRKVDDLIINTINSVIPTDSFHADGATACKDLHSQLTDGNNKRKSVIKNCITVSVQKVKELREKREADKDNSSALSKALRSEQTKVTLVLLLEVIILIFLL